MRLTFCNQTNFREFYWPNEKMLTSAKCTDVNLVMGVVFQSCYDALLVFQVSTLWDF